MKKMANLVTFIEGNNKWDVSMRGWKWVDGWVGIVLESVKTPILNKQPEYQDKDETFDTSRTRSC